METKAFKLRLLLIAIFTTFSSFSIPSLYQKQNTSWIKNYNKSIEENHNVVAETILTDSKITKGYKNLEFKLNNGITFEYRDGKYKANFNGRPVNVKGKYMVNCEIGKLSLAFNANDGSIWWVFTPKKES